MRFIAGELLNFLEQARAITLSPAADALFSSSRLYDGYADGVCAHGSNGADPSITVDLALKDEDGNDNGDLDTWLAGSPVGWTKTTSGGGTVAQTTAADEFRTGSAAKFNKSAGVARLTKVYRVRSGQRLNVSLWLRIAGAGQAKAQLRNVATKRYLTSGGAWQTAQAYFATETSATTYQEKTLNFTIEDFLACQAGVVLLELMVEDTGPGGGSDFAFLDDAFVWPSWNAVLAAGHNIEPGMAPAVRSSLNNFGGSDTLEASPAVRVPSFYGYLSTPSTRRWARLALTGTQSSQAGAPYYGELAITYLESAQAGSLWTYPTRYLPDNIVNAAPGGKTVAARTVRDRRRVLQLTFEPRSDAIMREHRDEIHARCHGALWPVIVVPIDAEDVVIHGRLEESLEIRRGFLAAWEDDLVITENPLPRVTP